MKRILVLGNSQAAAIYTGSKHLKNEIEENQIDLQYLFLGGASGGLSRIKCDSDMFVLPKEELLSDRGYKFINIPSLKISDYDFFVVAENLNPLDLRLYINHVPHIGRQISLMSQALVSAVCGNLQRYSECIQSIALKYPEKMIILSSPLPAYCADQQILARSYGEIILKQIYSFTRKESNKYILEELNKKIRHSCDPDNQIFPILFILPPADILCEYGFLTDHKYMMDDLLHGNDLYGSVMLRRVMMAINHRSRTT